MSNMTPGRRGYQRLLEKQIEVGMEAAQRLSLILNNNSVSPVVELEIKEVIAMLTATNLETWLLLRGAG